MAPKKTLFNYVIFSTTLLVIFMVNGSKGANNLEVYSFPLVSDDPFNVTLENRSFRVNFDKKEFANPVIENGIYQHRGNQTMSYKFKFLLTEFVYEYGDKPRNGVVIYSMDLELDGTMIDAFCAEEFRRNGTTDYCTDQSTSVSISMYVGPDMAKPYVTVNEKISTGQNSSAIQSDSYYYYSGINSKTNSSLLYHQKEDWDQKVGIVLNLRKVSSIWSCWGKKCENTTAAQIPSCGNDTSTACCICYPGTNRCGFNGTRNIYEALNYFKEGMYENCATGKYLETSWISQKSGSTSPCPHFCECGMPPVETCYADWNGTKTPGGGGSLIRPSAIYFLVGVIVSVLTMLP